MKTIGTTYQTMVCLGLAAAAGLMAQPPAGMRGGFGFGAISNRVITGAPFSATQTTQSQQTLANGNQIQHQQQEKIYRDSQGRVRTDTTFTPPASSGQDPRTVTTIFDPVAGYVYRLNAANMTVVQRPIPQPPPTGSNAPKSGPRGAAQGAQVQTQDLGTQAINGVVATGTQTTTTIPAGAIGNTEALEIVRTRWVSTALQIPVQVTVTDPRSGNRAMNLINIVQAEPDASLFQIPAGYTVTTGGRRGR